MNKISKTKKNYAPKALADKLGIGTCLYPPQESSFTLPEYSAADSMPDAPVAPDGHTIVSSPVLPFNFFETTDWRGVLEKALGRGALETATPGTGSADQEGEKLEAVLQAIVEHGQEMLPLLRRLRERAEEDARLSGLVELLQERLSLGINLVCSLAKREMEVLERAAKGQSNAEIAAELNLQTITVAKALSRAYRKLGAKNRTEAVHKWMLMRGQDN